MIPADFLPGTVVIVNDRIQRNYRYLLSAPVASCFDPEFEPDLAPREMLELGVFCGKYMTDSREEFPADWFINAKLASGQPDCSINYFGVKAGSSLAEWRKKGWIYPD